MSHYDIPFFSGFLLQHPIRNSLRLSSVEIVAALAKPTVTVTKECETPLGLVLEIWILVLLEFIGPMSESAPFFVRAVTELHVLSAELRLEFGGFVAAPRLCVVVLLLELLDERDLRGFIVGAASFFANGAFEVGADGSCGIIFGIDSTHLNESSNLLIRECHLIKV